MLFHKDFHINNNYRRISVPRWLRFFGLFCCLAFLSGCGKSKVPSPDVSTPQPPKILVEKTLPEVGVTLKVPQNWRFEQGIAPRVFTYWSGSASFTVWRYERSEPLPKTKQAITQAKTALENAIKAKNASFAPTVSQIKKIAKNVFAIEFVATATIDGQQKKVHSLHFFTAGSEIVFDAVAPITEFDRVDQLAFTSIINSLVIQPVAPKTPALPPPSTGVTGPQTQAPPASSSQTPQPPATGAPLSSTTPNGSAGTP